MESRTMPSTPVRQYIQKLLVEPSNFEHGVSSIGMMQTTYGQ